LTGSDEGSAVSDVDKKYSGFRYGNGGDFMYEVLYRQAYGSFLLICYQLFSNRVRR
jgi:hypothetical protein